MLLLKRHVCPIITLCEKSNSITGRPTVQKYDNFITLFSPWPVKFKYDKTTFVPD
jgi:hypothetical protein